MIAVAGASKAAAVAALGADPVLDRDTDLVATLGPNSVDAVIDLVGGPGWPALLDVLRAGGRYAVSGAIAGPIVALDLRTLYLKDLSFFGCTVLEPSAFPNLIGRIERGEVAPLVAATYPLREIAAAQAAFGEKRHVGKVVLEVR